jgi:hypothetical protein
MNQHLRSVPEYEPVPPPAVLTVEEKLCDIESQAFNLYLEISQTLNAPCSVAAPDEYLATRVISIFSKIGIVEKIVRILLGMDSNAWGITSHPTRCHLPL